MIDMHSKYDDMHKNGLFCALMCINNLIIACINYMLSRHQRYIVNVKFPRWWWIHLRGGGGELGL